jgi:hypothetical protein
MVVRISLLYFNALFEKGLVRTFWEDSTFSLNRRYSLLSDASHRVRFCHHPGSQKED